MRTDVLIIGAGGAGSAAALLAREQGAKVLMVTKLRHGDANTMMAEGGIQAATKGEKDSPYLHYLDVMGGGHFTNDPDLVEALVKDAPAAVAWLEELGAMLDKNPDGSMVERHGGGTSRMRMHSARSITKILPSPMFPVRAPAMIASIVESTNSAFTAISIRTFLRRFTSISAPR